METFENCKDCSVKTMYQSRWKKDKLAQSREVRNAVIGWVVVSAIIFIGFYWALIIR